MYTAARSLHRHGTDIDHIHGGDERGCPARHGETVLCAGRFGESFFEIGDVGGLPGKPVPAFIAHDVEPALFFGRIVYRP